MIQNIDLTVRKQVASDGCFLYQDDIQGNRFFTKQAFLGSKSKEWLECTESEKLAWEEAHKPKPSKDAPPLPEDVQEAELV